MLISIGGLYKINRDDLLTALFVINNSLYPIMNMRKLLIVIPMILLYLFSLIAFIVGGLFYSNQVSREQVLAWPRTDAVIISGELRPKIMSDKTYWMPVWAYSYSVGAASYTEKSDSLVGRFRGSWWEDKVSALKELNQRPIKEKNSVYYNPAEPSMSVLDPLPPTRQWVKIALLLFFMGVVFLGTAIFLQRANTGVSEFPCSRRVENHTDGRTNRSA
jgi:Protein of unknown function (DUF3592)